MVWFALGLLVSAYNIQSIKRFVSAISSSDKITQVRITTSYLMRYALNAALLLIAIQFGIREALFAFAGLWIYRWIFIVRFRRSHWQIAVIN